MALIKARHKAIDYVRSVDGRKSSKNDPENDCKDPKRFGDWFNRFFKRFRPIPEGKMSESPAVVCIQKKFDDVVPDDPSLHVLDDSNPNTEKSDLNLADILLNLLVALKDEQREILKMIYLKNMTQKEVAAKLGMPIGTVGVYCSRGLDKIRSEIRRHPQLNESLNEKLESLKFLPEIILLTLLMK